VAAAPAQVSAKLRAVELGQLGCYGIRDARQTTPIPGSLDDLFKIVR
jgi:hypothetical protein